MRFVKYNRVIFSSSNFLINKYVEVLSSGGWSLRLYFSCLYMSFITIFFIKWHQSLLCNSFTNSKSYANFLGNRAPCGSYTYLISWLKQHASKSWNFLTVYAWLPLTIIRRLVKRIWYWEQKVPSSVITSHLWITPDANSIMQNVQSFNPTD